MSGTTGTTGTTGTSGTRKALAIVLLLLTGSLVTPSLAQSPQSSVVAPGNGAITGTVVDSASGMPVSGAVVQIEGGPLREDYHVRQITDARGRFAFLRLANTGTYRISATKFGYLGGGYGREATHTDELRNITVRDGAWIQNLRVPIFRPGEITGVVRNETGEPVVGVYVRAYGKVFTAGHERLTGGPITVTDDRGHYRLARLLPGRYVIQVPSVQISAPASSSVTFEEGAAIAVEEHQRLMIGRYPLPPPGTGRDRMTYPPAFHPRAASIDDADVVTVHFGESKAGIDVTLTPVRAVTVSGRVAGPPEALVHLTVRLVARGMEHLGNGSETASALVAADGTFRFLNVPSGEYTLEVPLSVTEPMVAASERLSSLQVPQPFPRPLTQPTYADTAAAQEGFVSGDFRGAGLMRHGGRMKLAVGSSDLSGVTLGVGRFSTVSGSVVIDADVGVPPGKPAFIPNSSVSLDAADGRRRASGFGSSLGASSGVMVHRAEPGPLRLNRFELIEVEPGPYWIRLSGDWMVKSVTWRGRDYTTTPLEITAGDDLSDVIVTATNLKPTIAGVVRAPDGTNPGPTAVVVFPADRAARVNTGIRPTTMMSAVAGDSGNFWIAGMPAGDYLVAAIPQALLHDWQAPARLDEFERVATRISVRWGQTFTLELIRSLR
jgi:hypothetical protein